MYMKMILRGIKENRVISLCIFLFILAATLCLSLASVLTINLFSAVDHMLQKAKVPHFLQMHAGDLDQDRLYEFASTNELVTDMQVLKFLNIEGQAIEMGGQNLEASIQDNGLSTQSQSFDFLLDLDGNIIRVNEGQIYVPLIYYKEDLVSVGDTITIFGQPFVMKGFLRDAQMNSSLSSSKRFLIHEEDFSKLKDKGQLEYLIEFRLRDLADIGAFESTYYAAGFQSNGPSITYPLIRMINAISEGFLILIFIVLSILLVLIAFLSMRFTLLAKIEEDTREIAVLKAIGMPIARIKGIYRITYASIAFVASLSGFFISFLFHKPLLENIYLYMGSSQHEGLAIFISFLASLLIIVMVFISLDIFLKRLHKMSVVEALHFGTIAESTSKHTRLKLYKLQGFNTNFFLGLKDVLSRKRMYGLMFIVFVLSTFVLLLPVNVYTSISSDRFISYMGIGQSDILIRLEQTDQIKEKANHVLRYLENDAEVLRVVSLTNRTYDLIEDERIRPIKIELGDHSMFPLQYVEGRAARSDGEISLSILNAEDLEKTVGDTLIVLQDENELELIITGLYSDVTNGGKTAKAGFKDDGEEILWINLILEHQEGVDSRLLAEEILERYPYAKVAPIKEYIQQMYGETIVSVRHAALVSILTSFAMSALIVILILKMLMSKDRNSIAVLKSIGFTNRDIKMQYVFRTVVVFILAIFAGSVLVETLGQSLVSSLLAMWGAKSFQFVIWPALTYGLLPLAMASILILSILFSLKRIEDIKISAYLKE